ncbi:hypothetical protein KC19_VG169400 [Ceratodon purpureus]|uniref:Uncharacterized protein n=1 Tax=Ceratodon purpureus TaxID=3225 RepID=A0A8T0HRB4_CERPU|nr:hypothetical protein KC19_VG169400 [Ceratodon purpureus]
MSNSVETSGIEKCNKLTVEGGKNSELGGVPVARPMAVPLERAALTPGDGSLPVPDKTESDSTELPSKPEWLDVFKTDYYDKKRSLERERRRAFRRSQEILQSAGSSKEEAKLAGEKLRPNTEGEKEEAKSAGDKEEAKPARA